MGHRYLNSANAGSEVSPYDTVAGAASSFAQILALNGGANEVIPASEVIYVIDTHSEPNVTGGVNTVWTAPTTSTPEQPLRVFCVTNLSSPTTLSEGATFINSTANSCSVVGCVVFQGVYFKATYNGSSNFWTFCFENDGVSKQVFNNCKLFTHPTSTSTSFKLFNPTGQYGVTESSLEFNDLTINCSNTSVALTPQGLGNININNLSFDPASSATPESVFNLLANTQAQIRVTNSDLTGKSWSYFVDSTAAATGQLGDVFVRNCKLPSGTSWLKGSPGTASHVLTVTAVNCSSADSWTEHEYVNERTGVCSVNTTVYATTDPALFKAAEEYSVKMVSTANVSRFLPLYSEWMCVWNDASAYTPSVEVLVGADGAAALNTDELWIEVDYNSGTDSPLGTRLTTLPNVLTSGSAVAAGTTAWTGDGYTTERTHELSTAQITPDKPGYVWVRVALAKPSTTIYVNPARP